MGFQGVIPKKKAGDGERKRALEQALLSFPVFCIHPAPMMAKQ
jgi:hypothetical protein